MTNTQNKTSNRQNNKPKRTTKKKVSAASTIKKAVSNSKPKQLSNKQAAKKKAKPVVRKPKKPEKAPFKVIPLGGLKEIGKNCTLIECNDEILIIDCGLAFPEYEMFGIDIVIPDFTYIRENM